MSKFASIFSAFGLGGGGIKQAATPPPSPTPQRGGPEAESARKRSLQAQKLRRGRRSSILTTQQGVTDPLGSVGRPQARSSELLNG